MSLVNLSCLSTQACYVAPLKFFASKPRPSRFIMALTLPSPISASDDHNAQKWKEMTEEKIEIFKSLESWVDQSINQTFLKPVQSLWQPQDLLPDPSRTDEEFLQNIQEIRGRASEIPDEFYVCLVGNMITEEALPTYQALFNTFEGTKDSAETRETGWARWSRHWSAEENRHGDLLNKYLYLSGRVDTRQIEKTIQYLIREGMHVGADNNTFCGLIYTSFQERATFISHGNTARHAKHHGDTTLAKICGLIAADEKRHEMAYTKIVEKLFEVDPNTTMLSFAFMMKRRITMPALLMFDGHDDNLFNHFSMVAQAIGVYTVKDYVDIVEFLVERWNIEEVSDGLTSEGRRAQDYLCRLADRLRKMEERAMDKKKGEESSELTIPFSWIFNRKVTV